MRLFGINCLPPPMKETGYFSSMFTVGKLYCHLIAASVELALPLELQNMCQNPSMIVVQRFIKLFILCLMSKNVWCTYIPNEKN